MKTQQQTGDKKKMQQLVCFKREGVIRDRVLGREGQLFVSVYERATAATFDTTRCRLLFSRWHQSEPRSIAISLAHVQQHLQGCINHSALVTEPAYPAFHEQLPPHPSLR